jgi:hypothetical protein
MGRKRNVSQTKDGEITSIELKRINNHKKRSEMGKKNTPQHNTKEGERK